MLKFERICRDHSREFMEALVTITGGIVLGGTPRRSPMMAIPKFEDF
jgi:hypothetical protein